MRNSRREVSKYNDINIYYDINIDFLYLYPSTIIYIKLHNDMPTSLYNEQFTMDM